MSVRHHVCRQQDGSACRLWVYSWEPHRKSTKVDRHRWPLSAYAWCLSCCRIEGESHIELPCNEVHGEEKDRVVAKLSGAARDWWKSVVAGQHSFEKPAFQLGLNGWSVTNILPDGAHERTPGRIELLPNGAAGFTQVGDSMCFKLDVSGPLSLLMLFC